MIVITAPTGNIGHRVLDNVLAADQPVRVVARDPSKLPAAVRERVEIVAGSHSDPDVVARAFDGADAVFWLVPANPQAGSVEEAYVDFTRPAADAIREHGVARVVAVTALGRGTDVAHRAGFVTGSLAMDDLIAGTGVALRALAMPGFMDNLLRQVRSIKEQGEFFETSTPGLALPTVATRDIAAVATRYLLDDTWTGQEEVPVLGPEDLTPEQRAAVISEVLGSAVRFREMRPEDWRNQLTGFGMSEPMAQAMVDMAVAKQQGLDKGVARTPRHAIETPTTLRQWCEEVLRPAVLAA